MNILWLRTHTCYAKKFFMVADLCVLTCFRGENAKGRHAKPAKRWFCRVFRWRPFASPGKDTTNSSRKRNAWNVAYDRVAGRKTRKSHHLTGFRVVTFRVFAPVWRIFSWRAERSPRENTPNEKCRTLVWRGERSPCENTNKSPFGGFSRGAFSPFRPENTIIRHDTNQPPYFLFHAFFLNNTVTVNTHLNGHTSLPFCYEDDQAYFLFMMP